MQTSQVPPPPVNGAAKRSFTELLAAAKISYVGVTDHVHTFKILLDGETMQTTFNAQSNGFGCSCAGFDVASGSCQHIALLKLWRTKQSHSGNAPKAEQGDVEQPKSPSPVDSGTNDAAADDATAAYGADSAAMPDDVAELAARTSLPWGKFKGQTLAQLTATPEGLSYLFYVGRKCEPKRESDAAMIAVAGKLLLAVVEQHAQAASANPDQSMPVLPFGADKDKQLHKAHPKWTAILAKKNDDDARSFQDMVLYRVAKSLQAKRGGGRFYGGNGLSSEQFDKLLTELRGIRVALEQLAVPK